MAKAGQPSKYLKDLTPRVAGNVARVFAATDEQIADVMDVEPRTVENWKVAHPEYFQTLKAAKDSRDADVERSLWQRATGYSHEAEKIFLNKQGEIVRAKYIEHYPPDPTSMIFWLKNRQRELWRDRTELTGVDGGNLIVNLQINIKTA